VARIPEDQYQVALDLVYDRRRPASGGEPGYDPLPRYLELFEGVVSSTEDRAAELAGLPLFERLERRIVDGERKGLEADLDTALEQRPALDIVNDTLLSGMRTVGELFGAGEMQLPFVLQSAEVMKAAVAYLEPHMDRVDGAEDQSKGTIVVATVKGDVHDIGKNLVDIILSNNGYTVVNLGIKQPITTILEAAEEHRADAIGMSGLLVKSTVVMKENLEEMNQRGVSARWPVLLGGAALTRAYVEDDLAALYTGEVRYARDAFEGLRLMDAIATARTSPEVTLAEALPALRKRRVARGSRVADAEPASDARSDVAADNPVPVPPFWGSRVVRGLHLADYSGYLDERATFLGQWGLKGGRSGPSYEELVETEGRPRLRMWLDRLHTDGILDAGVVYGYWPAVSEGRDLVILDPDDHSVEVERFSFPRQRRDRRLCLSDYFRARDSGDVDVVAFQLVTMGPRIAEVTGTLFAENSYRDYLELHGLSVQLTEALAEYWHARVRDEFGFGKEDDDDLGGILRQAYRGSRYSFGYPACPDLADRAKLVRLLEPARIGVSLSEELQLHPEQSTDAVIVHHPEAKYFNAT
jgi:5-methyltetrahydrofolate--homocysteine methyltransferase